MKTLIISLLLVISVALGTNSYFLYKEKDIMEVEPASVTKNTIKEKLVIPGYVSPLKQLDILNPVKGRVAQVHIQAGEKVTKGQLLVSLADAEAEANVDKAEANLDKTKQDAVIANRSYDRLNKLLLVGGAAEQDVIDAEIEWKSALKLVDIQKKNLQLAKIEFHKVMIISPFDGVVPEIYIEEGQWLTPSSAVARILDNTTVEIVAETDPSDMRNLEIGQSVSIFLASVSTDKIALHGNISRIGIEATSKKRSNTVNVFIQVSSQNSDLKIGQLVDVEVVTEVREDVLLAPASSLIQRKTGTYVAVLHDQTIKLVKVVTGIADHHNVEIVEGLGLKDTIVYEPYLSISDGDKVELLR